MAITKPDRLSLTVHICSHRILLLLSGEQKAWASLGTKAERELQA